MPAEICDVVFGEPRQRIATRAVKSRGQPYTLPDSLEFEA
jgi:hypothetical protein